MKLLVSTNAGHTNRYTIAEADTATSAVVEVVKPAGAHATWPVVSTDGKRIAWEECPLTVSDPGDNSLNAKGLYTICVAARDGTGRKVVKAQGVPGGHPEFVGPNELVHFEVSGTGNALRARIVLSDATTGQRIRTLVERTPDPVTGGALTDPSGLSADDLVWCHPLDPAGTRSEIHGTKINPVFVEGMNVFDPRQNPLHPTWLCWLAWFSLPNFNGWSIVSSTGGPWPAFTPPSHDVLPGPPRYSPDGETIVYQHANQAARQRWEAWTLDPADPRQTLKLFGIDGAAVRFPCPIAA